ncbi:MAG: NAD-binding protein [Rhodomicrobium sp.]
MARKPELATMKDSGGNERSIYTTHAARKVCADFFAEVIGTHHGRAAETSCFVITHLLEDRPFYLAGLNHITQIGRVCAKPKSVVPHVWNEVAKSYPVDFADRACLGDAAFVKDLIENAIPGSHAFLLMDLGGYFAGVGAALHDHYGSRFLGIVEDTENGHQRYLSVPNPRYPVFSAARSPLKAPEDFLVGQSIVFSLEALLREWGTILQGRSICIIGYGKLGQSAAHLLKQRGSNVSVYDIDPLKLVLAKAHGFIVSETLKDGIIGADTVICATGNYSLNTQTISWLKSNCIVATVTSSDDELKLDDIENYYKEEPLTKYISRYINDQHSFFLLNRGHAVNFIHGASVGEYIFLVQAELIAGAAALIRGEGEPGICEIPAAERRRISKAWLRHFWS